MATVGYVDTDDFTSWLAARGYSISGTATQLLTRAFDYLEQQNFKGRRTLDTQANSWPRYPVYIDGILIDINTVPQQVLDVQMRIAYDMDKGADPLSTDERRKSSVSVDGAISVTYEPGSSDSFISGQTSLLLSKLIDGGVGNQVGVSRG